MIYSSRRRDMRHYRVWGLLLAVALLFVLPAVLRPGTAESVLPSEPRSPGTVPTPPAGGSMHAAAETTAPPPTDAAAAPTAEAAGPVSADRGDAVPGGGPSVSQDSSDPSHPSLDVSRAVDSSAPRSPRTPVTGTHRRSAAARHRAHHPSQANARRAVTATPSVAGERPTTTLRTPRRGMLTPPK